jgi:hypothetical protein
MADEKGIDLRRRQQGGRALPAGDAHHPPCVARR